MARRSFYIYASVSLASASGFLRPAVVQWQLVTSIRHCRRSRSFSRRGVSEISRRLALAPLRVWWGAAVLALLVLRRLYA